ncbi:MAG: S4 domain-containing protein [Gemmatimonadales bacterium]
MPADPLEAVRLDKWLWAARFYKTRPLAVAAIEGGRVQVNGDRVKRAKSIKRGDQIRIRQGAFEYQLEVRELSERRGSATVAATLYDETAESLAAREKLAFQLKNVAPAAIRSQGRPSKKQRRDIEKWKRGG